MTTYVRRNMWTLETPNPWDPYTTGYAQAVAAMRARPATDPTSWTYQAAMHGTYANPPAGADWNQCQHGTWFFLPWHRMYLYFFERIVRKAVIAANGPQDWALPYWNYSVGKPTNALPPAFRQPKWTPPGGGGQQANPLYTDKRNKVRNVNNGAGLPQRAVSFTGVYAYTNFSGAPLPGFGGPVTGFSHDSGNFGALESQPHNNVHMLVGGDNPPGNCSDNWMSDPNCAAEDPIFWIHHSNIDRLWTNWIALGGGRADPNLGNWLTFQFTFYDENGAKQTMTPADVLDTLHQLGYMYDDNPAPALVRARFAMAVTPPPQPPEPPRMVAATAEPVELGTGRTDVTVPLPDQAQQAIAATADKAGKGQPGHVYLNVEGLDSDIFPGLVYEVHVNLPAGADLETEGEESFVGTISFFGFKREATASEQTPNHPLGPLAHTFDITGRVLQLRSQGDWDDKSVDVSFVPLGLEPAEGEQGTAHDVSTEAKPRVGRVSISYH